MEINLEMVVEYILFEEIWDEKWFLVRVIINELGILFIVIFFFKYCILFKKYLYFLL